MINTILDCVGYFRLYVPSSNGNLLVSFWYYLFHF
ncbi:hypothetical protein AVEN109717_07340 [Avibacterium endocarditidis]